MTDRISTILHWNIDYAEFPRREAEQIVEMSYIPMIDELLNHELGPILMNITGHTLEYLIDNYPNLIAKIKSLVVSNRIEIIGSGYSHPILPILPKWRRFEQLKSHREQIIDTFDQVPKGFWPPELAISPIIANEINEIGYDWIAVDHEHLMIAQNYHNDLDPFTDRDQTITEALIKAYWAKWWQIPIRYYQAYKTAMKWIKRFRNPAITVINLQESINLMQISVAWTNSTIFALQHTPPFFTKKKLISVIKQSDLTVLPIYGSDIEFFGYRSHVGDAPTPDVFVEFLDELHQGGIQLTTPTVEPSLFVNSDIKITTGSWAPDKSLRIWTDSEDNKELTRRTQEIYNFITANEQQNTDIIKSLRVAENSDARGWSPINERKHEAFNSLRHVDEIINNN